VTLFAQQPDDLKEVVYKMRFDQASAVYAEFGPFVTGVVGYGRRGARRGRGGALTVDGRWR
jgi:peroxiredoxin